MVSLQQVNVCVPVVRTHHKGLLRYKDFSTMARGFNGQQSKAKPTEQARVHPVNPTFWHCDKDAICA